MPTNLYALIEARPDNQNFGLPFYVGIGTAKRPYVHFKHARTPTGCRNRLLQVVIAGHFASGIDPVVTILGTFTTKDEAGAAEVAAIQQWGRLGCDPDGILCNIAKGGQGPDVELMNRPDIKAKIGAWATAYWAAPEKRQAVANKLKRLHVEEPERWANVPKKAAAAAKKSWASPETRAKHEAALRGVKKTMSPAAIESRRANARKPRSAEALAKQKAAAERNWSDPDFRAKRSRNQTAAWDDPEKRAKMLAGRAQGISKSWADPEVRARRIAGIKAAAARRAENQGGHDEPSASG